MGAVPRCCHFACVCACVSVFAHSAFHRPQSPQSPHDNPNGLPNSFEAAGVVTTSDINQASVGPSRRALTIPVIWWTTHTDFGLSKCAVP